MGIDFELPSGDILHRVELGDNSKSICVDGVTFYGGYTYRVDDEWNEKLERAERDFRDRGAPMANYSIPLREAKIAGLSYDPTSRVLTVTYDHGCAFIYPEVPEDVFAGLKSAADRDAFFKENILGKFSF